MYMPREIENAVGMRPNKKIRHVSGNRSENRHNYFFNYFFFLEKIIILCILKGILPFKMPKSIFFGRKPNKILGFASKFR